MNKKIYDLLQEGILVKKSIQENQNGLIAEFVQYIIACYRNNKKVVLFGNGGSAADSQHIAAEFVGRFKKERKALPAIALTTDTSILTALGNDYDFSYVFARQIKALVNKDDVVIAITTSGNSPNVIKGIESAIEKEAKVIVFTGGKGGKVKDMVKDVFIVPSSNTPRIQEAHIAVAHIICQLVEEEFEGT